MPPSIGCLTNWEEHLYVKFSLLLRHLTYRDFWDQFAIFVCLMHCVCFCRHPNHPLDLTSLGSVCRLFLSCVTGWSMLWSTVKSLLFWCNVKFWLMERSGLTRPIQLVLWVCIYTCWMLFRAIFLFWEEIFVCLCGCFCWLNTFNWSPCRWKQPYHCLFGKLFAAVWFYCDIVVSKWF